MQQDIKQVIKETYGSTALQAEKTGEAAKRVAQAFGYSQEDLEAIPKESNMGLSCGNPLALASLKEGEVVVDLGSGGGLDCFLAAKRVGSTGRVIGVDMTPAMIELATSNAKKFGKDNVEFRQGEIEHMPVEDNTVDCVISNCVINLSTDKQQVFNEVFRVLKPGGRLAVSDICLKKALPTELKEAVMAYVGCVAGALLVDTYKEMMQKAGFGDVDVVDSHADLNVYATLKEDGGAAACCASTAPVGCCGESKSAPAPSSSSCCTPAPSQKSEGGGCCGGSVSKASSSSCCTPAPSQKSEGGGCCGGSVAPAREEKGGACCGGDSSSAYSSMKGFGEVVELLKKYDVNEYAGSFKIFAVKPHNN